MFVRSKENDADIFTKNVTGELYDDHSSKLVWDKLNVTSESDSTGRVLEDSLDVAHIAVVASVIPTSVGMVVAQVIAHNDECDESRQDSSAGAHNNKRAVCVESFHDRNKTSLTRSYRVESTLMGSYPSVEATLTGSATCRNGNIRTSDLVPKIDDHDHGLNHDMKREDDWASKGIACSSGSSEWPVPN